MYHLSTICLNGEQKFPSSNSFSGRKELISSGQSAAFAQRERAKEGMFAQELTETIQGHLPLKRFLLPAFHGLITLDPKT